MNTSPDTISNSAVITVIAEPLILVLPNATAAIENSTKLVNDSSLSDFITVPKPPITLVTNADIPSNDSFKTTNDTLILTNSTTIVNETGIQDSKNTSQT